MSASPRPFEGGSFRAIEHTADEAFELEAGSYPALLAAGARAVCARIGAAPAGSPLVQGRLRAEGVDREDLLVRLAQAVLLRFALADLLLAEVLDLVVSEGADGALTAELSADFHRVDRAAAPQLCEVKAVTYHDLHVREDPPGTWRARLVLDL